MTPEKSPIIDPTALESLFQPWEEPTAHRIKNPKAGEPAIVEKHRRPSPIAVVQNLRSESRQWREAFYVGASDTSRELLTVRFAPSVPEHGTKKTQNGPELP